MNRLKSALQKASDIMNDPKLENKNDMAGIKEIVVMDRRIIEAILAYKAKKENIVGEGTNTTPVITAEQIRNEMQRPMIETEEKEI